MDDILSSPNTYHTIHFDETTTVQLTKQMDILVRYFSETNGEIKVRFLKALVFGPAFGEKVGDELLKTLEELELPLKLLLSNINAKLKQCFKRQLVNTGSCQLHVVHNTFRKGLERYGEDIENLCIDLFYFFKLSAARREDFLKIQQNLSG